MIPTGPITTWNRKHAIGSAILAVAVLTVGACGRYDGAAVDNAKAEPRSDTRLKSARETSTRATSIPNKTATLPDDGGAEPPVRRGMILPGEKVAVLALAEGTIRQIHVKPGTAVAAGDLLADLDAPQLTADALQAREHQQQAQEKLEQARHGLEQLESAEPQVRQALDRAEDMQSRLERRIFFRRLKQRVAAGIEKAEQGLSKIESGRSAALAMSDQLGDAVHQASLAGAVTERRVEAARITAPARGVVAAVHVEAGEQVKPGTRVADVIDARQLKTGIWLDPHQAAQVAVGDAAIIRPDGYDRDYPARVAGIAPAMDNRTRRVLVLLRIENADGLLRPYLGAEVRLSPASPK